MNTWVGCRVGPVLEHTWFLWVKKPEIFEFLYYIDFFDERKMYLLLKSTKRGGNNYPRHTICIGGGSDFFFRFSDKERCSVLVLVTTITTFCFAFIAYIVKFWQNYFPLIEVKWQQTREYQQVIIYHMIMYVYSVHSCLSIWSIRR